VTPTPQQFYERAVAAADAERRLPVPDQTGWEIFPFAVMLMPRDHLDLGEVRA
jgi:hypothetical protein